MTQNLAPASLALPAQPTLFYKHSCLPCRRLSALALCLSFGMLRRVAIDAAEAEILYQQHPEWRGQLMLTYRQQVWLGARVLPVVPLVVCMHVYLLSRRALRRALQTISLSSLRKNS